MHLGGWIQSFQGSGRQRGVLLQGSCGVQGEVVWGGSPSLLPEVLPLRKHEAVLQHLRVQVLLDYIYYEELYFMQGVSTDRVHALHLEAVNIPTRLETSSLVPSDHLLSSQ